MQDYAFKSPIFLLNIALLSIVSLSCGDKSTSNKPPCAPSNISGHAVSSSAVIINWSDNSDNETGFVVYRKNTGSWSMAATAGVDRISYIDSLLRDSTIYSYRVTAKNDAGESAPSDSIALSTMSVGAPPQTPSNPLPPDSATGIAINTRLTWVCSDPDGDSLRYDIYFGSGSYLELLDSNLVNNYFDPGSLLYNTAYVWKIIARDNHRHTVSGPIWHFRTRPNSPPMAPSSPIPTDDSSGVDINLSLNWRCADPDSDNLSYDVYFGQDSAVGPVAVNIAQSSFDPGRLLYGAHYLWRIAAKDTFSHEIRGPLWNFITRDSVYNLNVLLQGLGTVTISPDRPNYLYGDSVTLTAVPDSSWSFAGWSGEITDSRNPLAIVITRNLSLVANFREGHSSSATISGTVSWPGHALSSHTYFFADSIIGYTPYLVGQTTVDPGSGSYTLRLNNMTRAVPLIFEAQDDVNNSGAHDPIDSGDGWWFFDHNGDGQWGIADTLFVAPGDSVTNIDIVLQLRTMDK